MAKATFKMPEDFLMRISKLGNQTDEILPKVLQAGAEIVESEIRANLQNAVGHGTAKQSRSTGELINALGISGAKQDREGNMNVKIGFSEPRSDGQSNAKIANILEYGKSGQPPKPFLAPAKSATKKSCINEMKNKLEEELKKI